MGCESVSVVKLALEGSAPNASNLEKTYSVNEICISTETTGLNHRTRKTLWQYGNVESI